MTTPILAALYLRSSKDRSDVSIDAQRRELTRLATEKRWSIVAEYADVVESAKDERRPQFQRLLTDMKARGRTWNACLMLEPSRLSRNQHVAHVFTHDARQYGVKVVFAQMPEPSPVVDIILTPMMHAWAHYHSYESKRKGLAGMAENVKRGFRAGGRAPIGYRLERIATGAVREGEPVLKSRLVPSDKAPAVQAYLLARAKGIPRNRAADLAGLDLVKTSLNGLEHNALTYAGHTVWNVHNERTREGYIGGRKRRPRTEWVIQRETHEALISDDDAERILARLERRATGNPKEGNAFYLLKGLLVDRAGRAWHGDGGGKYYRCGGRKVRAEDFNAAVRTKIVEDLRSGDFAHELVREAKRARTGSVREAMLEERRAVAQAVGEKMQMLSAALEHGLAVRTLLEKIESLQRDRDGVLAEIAELEREVAEEKIVKALTDEHVELLLGAVAGDMPEDAGPELRDYLRDLVQQIELDPETLQCRIHYAIQAARGESLASPRPRRRIPPLRLVRTLAAA